MIGGLASWWGKTMRGGRKRRPIKVRPVDVLVGRRNRSPIVTAVNSQSGSLDSCGRRRVSFPPREGHAGTRTAPHPPSHERTSSALDIIPHPRTQPMLGWDARPTRIGLRCSRRPAGGRTPRPFHGLGGHGGDDSRRALSHLPRSLFPHHPAAAVGCSLLHLALLFPIGPLVAPLAPGPCFEAVKRRSVGGWAPHPTQVGLLHRFRTASRPKDTPWGAPSCSERPLHRRPVPTPARHGADGGAPPPLRALRQPRRQNRRAGMWTSTA